MDRNREGRRATTTTNNNNMAAPPNGLSSSRRRHRSSSLRDSPDEDGAVELQESGRLRDRGVVKKDRGDRDRDRERERERSSRSKRRRENRMMIHHVNTGINRDDGDDTSEESVNDEDEEDDDDAGGNGGGLRMLPPPPANPTTATTAMTSNHHNNNHNPQQQLHHRKSFPPSANKVFRAAATAAAPPPAWKAADEMIGVSVPRKARSASTKRSHEWISGGGAVVGGGGGGAEQAHRQSSTSPIRLASSVASPALVAPPSPSSSNVSVRKKMKPNGGGGSKPRPPKSSSKSSSSNPEELEIEIAEVLYGLMTQSQAPSKKENDSTTKFDSNKSSSDTKSRVSSPISNSTAPPQNSTSLSTVAPKRKRPRQVSENPFSVRSSPVSSSIKTEIDHHQHHQSPKTDISSPYLENNSPGSAVAVAAAENGVSFGFTSVPAAAASSAPVSERPMALPQPPVEEEGKCGVGVVLTKEEVEKESPAVGINNGNGNGNGNTEAMIATAASTTATNLNTASLEAVSQKEEKFEIDLMAPPPQVRTSPERDGVIGFSDHKQMAKQEMSKNLKDKEDEKLKKSAKEETMNLTDDQKQPKVGNLHETGESSKQSMIEERNIELHIDLEKPNKDSSHSMVSGGSNRSLHQALKHQQLSAKSETHTEKTAQPSSMPTMPMSVANWPPMGYVSPLQGVIPMDGNKPPSAPIQPIFTHPRPKRCATHCYIARNIHYLQQFMKLNPFWPAASGSPPIVGTIPMQAIQEKGPAVGIFPAGKDNKSSQATAVPDPTTAHRKQQVLLQQPLPPVTPNNILHGPAFIFPFNQQQAVAAAAAAASASVRPGSSKLNSNSTGGGGGGSGAPTANSATMSSSTVPAAAQPALSFNYSNMTANETQYLAILQNNPYTFPIPAGGTPPNYRGNPHAQPMPLFNGSFYSSQMIHPSQIPQPPQQQAPPPTQPQNHHPSHSQQTHQNSSGSTSSSQKHLQAQQRQQQGSGAAVNGGGSGNGTSLHNSYPGHKSSRSQPPPSQQQQQQPQQHMNPLPQARHLENEVTGGEDSPSTADSRGSRAANTTNVYGHNFAMPVHHSQHFAMMNSAMSMAAASGNNSNDKKQQQQQQQSQQQGLKRGGVESSSLPPQTFAMSFAPMNGTTGTISSMAQNHAIFQSLPESLRQSYHHMMTAPPVTASAHHSQQKKDFRLSEEASRTTVGHDSSNGDEDRKSSITSGLVGKIGTIAFARPDLAPDASGSSSPIPGTSVIDSSSRNINLGSNNRSSRSPMSTSVAAAQSSHHLHAQFHHHHQQQQQQQQVLQLQKQQQQNARNKNQPSSNGSAYPDHLITSSKFPNSISSFPQNLVQTSNTSSSPATQSPQWRNSVRGPTTSQVPSSLTSVNTSSSSSLKNLHQSQQQQSNRSHAQSHTQISFGAAATQKLPSTTSSSQIQQQQQQNPSSNSSNQCPSPPMLVGSPTTSSISKGNTTTTTTTNSATTVAGGGSPRTNPSASTSGRTGQPPVSLSSSQQPKNSPVGNQRSSPSPSILGNPHITNSNPAKSQQQPQQTPKQSLQQQQQAQQQAHLFFTHPYMPVQQQQGQGQQHSGGGSTGTSGGYYIPRKQQQQQQQQQNPQPTSTGMLSLASGTTSDPAKAIAAATSNLKGGGGGSQQGIIHAYAAATQTSNAGHQLLPAGFPQYAPTPVQVKPADQKQPAGNDNLRTCWQPEKK